jgi:hypothetical protein
MRIYIIESGLTGNLVASAFGRVGVRFQGVSGRIIIIPEWEFFADGSSFMGLVGLALLC